MIELVPALITLTVIWVFLTRLAGKLAIQAFVAIVAAYIVFFPALEFLLSFDRPLTSYATHQILFSVLFIMPLIAVINHESRSDTKIIATNNDAVELNPIAAIVSLFLLTSFVLISYSYELYLVRINYNENNVTTDAPTILLAVYRIVLETSFFVILFLIYCLKSNSGSPGIRRLYRLALVLYLSIFTLFFFINSRMQFVILIILLIICSYRPNRFSNRKISIAAISVILLIVLITILREVYIEQTNRLDISDLGNLMRETILLISSRLNGVVMLDQAGDYGYGFDIFSVDFSGLAYFVNLNTSFFTNPELYADLRESQITSPSVYMINSILLSSYVDFPKSMVVDTVLTFGAFGLPFLAYILGRMIVYIDSKLRFGNVADFGFVVAIYVLTLTLQFEKEFLGFLSFLLKWSPILALFLFLRPKRASDSSSPL